MSARDAILAKVRGALKAGGDSARREAVDGRMAAAKPGIIPARGQLDPIARADLFCAMAEKAAATVQRVTEAAEVPAAITDYLRNRNLAPSIRMGQDPRLAELPWADQRTLEVRVGRSDGEDMVGVSHAFGGVAETGTLVMISGADNPTTLNFLPEHHVVVVEASDVAGDMENVLARIRGLFGKGAMPRTVNLITGPSRSGDVEQKIVLGAHGPKALHIIVVGDP